MKNTTVLRRFVLWTLLGVATLSAPAQAQVGQGLLDFNSASVEQLTVLPHLNAEHAQLLCDQRPFTSVLDLNRQLLSLGLNAEQAGEIYREAFVHVNLNTGTREEILLIPGAGRRIAHEFDEYRPWKSRAHFEREIGKYVADAEVARLWRYVTVDAAGE